METTQEISRRRFLRRGSGAAAAGLVAPSILARRALGAGGRPGANESIVIGFIGAGNRGRMLMRQTPPPGRIVAICDVYLQRCEETLKENAAIAGGWQVYQDYRRILDRQDIDAVVVPTPDHGRVLPSIHACQAGKDIYAEKPLTLTIAEGRALVRAVRTHGRVFQTGSQQRTMEFNRYACELVRSGRIGKLQAVYCCNYPGPGTCNDLPEMPIPKGLDWDQWCAQTPLKPYSSRLQFGWMGCRDYSGGEMTNWGAHGLDQVQWAVGADGSGPVEIWPASDGPNGKVHMRYASGVLVRLELPSGPILGGGIFVGDRGKIEIHRNAFIATPAELAHDAPEPYQKKPWEGRGWKARLHIKNWLEAIETRSRPNADVEIGHRSITVCHLANIAREVGRRLRWDPVSEVFIGDAEANSYLDRPKRRGYELPDPV